MMIKTMLILILSLAGGFAGAETSMLSTSVRSESTSDGYDLTLSRIEWQSHRRDLFWPYANEAPSGLDLGISGDINSIIISDRRFSGYAVKLMPGVKFSPALAVHGGVGWHTVEEEDTEDELSAMAYEAAVSFVPSAGASLLLSYEDDFSYSETLHQDLSLNLRTQKYTASFTLRPWTRLQLRGNGSYSRISDGNERAGGNLALLYGIFTSEPWWWIGAIGEYMGYTEDVEAYWSPERFVSYGLYSEATFPLIGILSGSLSGQITRTRENDFDPGVGRFISAGLALGRRDSVQLQVSYNYIKSSQENSSWSSQGLLAQVHSSF